MQNESNELFPEGGPSAVDGTGKSVSETKPQTVCYIVQNKNRANSGQKTGVELANEVKEGSRPIVVIYKCSDVESSPQRATDSIEKKMFGEEEVQRHITGFQERWIRLRIIRKLQQLTSLRERKTVRRALEALRLRKTKRRHLSGGITRKSSLRLPSGTSFHILLWDERDQTTRGSG
ncbi:hypothetical protein QR680_013503 [Steinernema hermaphroditum]|uniref:Uncharacterized protein n=1 Tax=Steinernema hermaphroditum TaxID=289476 RepID=A0AA39I818_9BILA|nr:hypothetical protein QR680_013503 [Steinernema hermaphroditum]